MTRIERVQRKFLNTGSSISLKSMTYCRKNVADNDLRRRVDYAYRFYPCMGCEFLKTFFIMYSSYPKRFIEWIIVTFDCLWYRHYEICFPQLVNKYSWDNHQLYVHLSLIYCFLNIHVYAGIVRNPSHDSITELPVE